MTKLYVISDTHFGHGNVIKFADDKGNVIRRHPETKLPFKDIDEHDELLIRLWNETVTDSDFVYHLGDFAISKQVLKRVAPLLKGKKRLVRGNHDINDTKDYLDVGFKEIYGVRVFPKQKVIMSHIPIHPGSIKPGWGNIHGHLHNNILLGPDGKEDPRYCCVSVERTKMKPLFFMDTDDA